jgi:hypothetical protein
MKIMFFALVALFLNNDCSNSQKDKETGMEYTILEKGSQSSIKSENQKLILSQEQFTEIWKENFAMFIPVPAIPDIDFSQKMVIAAWMGEKNKGGFEIDLRSIHVENELMVITLKYIQPGKNCISTMAMEQPFLFVITGKHPAEKVKFQTENEIRKCN